MVTAYIGIGSNIGDRLWYIQQSLQLLGQIPGIEIIRISSVIETKAQGGPRQPDFLNAVAKIQTVLPVRQLLESTQSIESSLGRVRTIKNGPRTIDLDILLYGDTVINEPDLIVPHPRMFEREFVLRPLAEIEPLVSQKLERLKNIRTIPIQS